MQEKKQSLLLPKIPRNTNISIDNESINKIPDEQSLKGIKPELITSTPSSDISPRSRSKTSTEKMYIKANEFAGIQIPRTSHLRLSNTNKSPMLLRPNIRGNTERNNRLNNSGSITENLRAKVNNAKESSESIVKDFYLSYLLDPKKNKDMNETRYQNGFIPSEDYILNKNYHDNTSKSATTIKLDFSKNQSTRNLGPKYFDSLPASLRMFYTEKKEFIKSCEDIDIALYCLEEIIDRVKCYRCELGIVLEKLEVTFKKILEKLLENTMKYLHDKDQTFEKIMKENSDNLEKLNMEKFRLEEQNKHFQSLINVQKSEVNIYQLNMSSMENEIKLLHELLRKDILAVDQNRNRIELESPNSQMLKRSRDIKETKAPVELLENGLVNLQNSIFNLEKEQYNKGALLQSMNNLLKAMLKGGKQDVSTQVEEAELTWKSKHIYSIDSFKPKVYDYQNYEGSSINFENKLKEAMEKNQASDNIDTIEFLNIKEKDKDKSQSGDAEDQLQFKDSLKSKSLANLKNMPQDLNVLWNLPLCIIVFLENVTKSGDSASVLPWPFFRKMVYDIYDDRLSVSSEINHSLMGTYIQMSEYICIYFLKLYKLRRLAEIKLLEFLVSLKYYIKIWPRALLFASLCNMLSKQSNFNEIGDFSDCYSQHFFFFAYSIMITNTTILLEDQEGTTWFPKEKIEYYTKEILIFEDEANQKKFCTNLVKYLKSIVDATGKEREYIDIDRLLMLYMEAYKEAKQSNNKILSKNFYKFYPSGEGVFSLDEFSSIITEVYNVEISNPNYTFPKTFPIPRTFMYALTSTKNGFSINYKDFSQACSRFGLDCPFPFIFTNSSADIKTSNSAYSNQYQREAYMLNSGIIDKGAFNYLIRDPKNPNAGTKRGSNLNQSKFEGKKIGEFDDNNSFHLITKNEKELKKKESDMGKPSSIIKIDSASSLFAQHFSILRELRSYCLNFKEAIQDEANNEVLLKCFSQIVQVLDTGCKFLSLPISA